MAWWNFSLTPAANGTADPTQNWPEGMSPSSVNDSARALLSRCAEYRDLISGKLVTGGSPSSYTLASGQNPAFDSFAHLDGQMIAFTPHVTNTAAATLNVDGLGPKPLRTQTGSNVDGGVLIAGTPYVVTYFNAVGEFILQGFQQQSQTLLVPIGAFLFHSVATVPNSNFVMPIGQAISRTTYAIYFGMVGTTFGTGDGVSTFNIPDLRSRMLLPLATMGGADLGRVTTAGSGIDGATVGATGGAQNVTLDSTMIPAHTHGVTETAHTHFAVALASVSTSSPPTASTQVAHANTLGSDFSYLFGQTTNPANIALTSASTTGLSVDSNTGGGAFHRNMPPCIVLPIILRVL